jgi:dTDP-glucose 4,6-dehydratase
MKHIIFGGDGFLGTELTRKLADRGEQVLICDEKQSLQFGNYDLPGVQHFKMDVCDPQSFASIPVDQADIVYHFAARLLMPILPRRDRHDYFWKALYTGTQNVLNWMTEKELRQMIYFTTDMVYGHTEQSPRTEEHACKPIGPYGEAKYKTELLVDKYRSKGFKVSLFRPRLIIGHGRLGILEKLFRLIDMSLPVPTIGSGRNYYQFISVSDCADASIAAVQAGIPNSNYNLGSSKPPTVNELLGTLIKEAGSRTILIPTPAFAVKWLLAGLDMIGKPLMDPEQYLIADETCVLDCSKAERELGWVPKDDDTSMLLLAYHDFRAGKSREP